MTDEYRLWIDSSTEPCYANRTPNPRKNKSKWRFSELEVGQSVFIRYESEGKFPPYGPGKARMAANNMNRTVKGIKLKTIIKQLTDNIWLMEIARIA